MSNNTGWERGSHRYIPAILKGFLSTCVRHLLSLPYRSFSQSSLRTEARRAKKSVFMLLMRSVIETLRGAWG